MIGKVDLNDEKLFRKLMNILFILYLILLVWALFFKFGMGESLKKFYIDFSSKYSLSYRFYRCIIPFTKIVERGDELHILPAFDVRDVMNVFAFVPFGFFAFCLTNENKRKTLLFSFVATAIIEGGQFFTLLGAFASKDLITNFLGGAIGMFAFMLYKRIRFDKIHNILAIFFVCLASVMVVVAVCTVAINIDDYLFVLLRKQGI